MKLLKKFNDWLEDDDYIMKKNIKEEPEEEKTTYSIMINTIHKGILVVLSLISFLFLFGIGTNALYILSPVVVFPVIIITFIYLMRFLDKPQKENLEPLLLFQCIVAVGYFVLVFVDQGKFIQVNSFNFRYGLRWWAMLTVIPALPLFYTLYLLKTKKQS